MSTYTTAPVRKRRWWIVVVAALAAIGLIVAGVIFAPSLFSSFNGEPNAEANMSNEIDADLAQCRVDAIVAYMGEGGQGFSDGDYVIGEENIDTTAPELVESGSAAFSDPILTRAALQDLFNSDDRNAQLATQAQLNKFPDLPTDVLLDAENWEIVQMKVATNIPGNTGVNGGAIVNLDTRDSAAGDAGWYFVDPATCTVPTSEITASGDRIPEGTPESEKPVGFIRVGCANPGDGHRPPPKEECPPDMPHGTPEACKDGIEAGPNQQGNLPEQQRPNPLPADPDHAQPTEPTAPPTTYTPPPKPPVEPAPEITPNPPAPPAPPPVVVEEDQDLGDGGEPDW